MTNLTLFTILFSYIFVHFRTFLYIYDDFSSFFQKNDHFRLVFMSFLAYFRIFSYICIYTNKYGVFFIYNIRYTRDNPVYDNIQKNTKVVYTPVLTHSAVLDFNAPCNFKF
jgi:hypothetical protein